MKTLYVKESVHKKIKTLALQKEKPMQEMTEDMVLFYMKKNKR